MYVSFKVKSSQVDKFLVNILNWGIGMAPFKSGLGVVGRADKVTFLTGMLIRLVSEEEDLEKQIMRFLFIHFERGIGMARITNSLRGLIISTHECLIVLCGTCVYPPKFIHVVVFC